MPTYKNCHELVREVRQGLNEYDDALASGEDTAASFRNDLIINEINKAIGYLFGLIARRRPGEFLKEVELPVVNSVLTLPANFGKLVLFRDPDGRKVYSIEQGERRLREQVGSDRLYHQMGRTLVLDKAGVNSTYTLIYKTKPRDIHMGKVSAIAYDDDVPPNPIPTQITLDSRFAPKIADYFNGMVLENIKKDWADTITAYTAARVATVTQSSAAGDLYGLVPEIPEWSHVLIAGKAVIQCKLNPVSQAPPSQGDAATYNEQLITLFREFCTQNEDQDYEEIFTSFEPKTGGAF